MNFSINKIDQGVLDRIFEAPSTIRALRAKMLWLNDLLDRCPMYLPMFRVIQNEMQLTRDILTRDV